MMKFSDIYSKGKYAELLLEHLIRCVQLLGPSEPSHMEALAHLKQAHPRLFARRVDDLLMAMGLFYKAPDGKGVFGLVQRHFEAQIMARFHQALTPAQAHMRLAMERARSFSFSAPTSAGKSHLLREWIRQCEKNVVIVLPSRALILEYEQELREAFGKEVMVLQFVERVNLARAGKSVFVITPERGGNLFSLFRDEEIGLVIFDEAQLSEDATRGYYFDAFVSNIYAHFPSAKKVFAHPFIANPEAQIKKYAPRDVRSLYKNYPYESVGKLFVTRVEREGAPTLFRYFSPYGEVADMRDLPEDPIMQAIARRQPVLIYASKRSLLSKSFQQKYKEYVEMCPPLRHADATRIITAIGQYIGESRRSEFRRSVLLEYMRRGIVCHHGSMPLKVRYLVEEFVRRGYARVCFATSTLLQGINMPFSLVWLADFRFRGASDEAKALSLRNLIGRAGRSTGEKVFDTGIVVVNEKNRATFRDRLRADVRISETTVFDVEKDTLPEEIAELAEAVQKREYNTQYNMPASQLERLGQPAVTAMVAELLERLFVKGKIMTLQDYYGLLAKERDAVKGLFHRIYAAYVNRPLAEGEEAVISTALPIFLSRLHGASLRGIVRRRLAYMRRRQKSSKRYYAVQAAMLPNKELKKVNLFGSGDYYDFDALVYDTYDYIDKVIGYSLSPPMCAALDIYYERLGNPMARKLSRYIRYGTDDEGAIWLLKYGLPLEDVERVLPCIASVDENCIVFNEKAKELPEEVRAQLQRYE